MSVSDRFLGSEAWPLWYFRVSGCRGVLARKFREYKSWNTGWDNGVKCTTFETGRTGTIRRKTKDNDESRTKCAEYAEICKLQSQTTKKI
jgi:hypothetical protein